MQYRKLGHTEMQISLLGLGGIPLQRSTSAEVTELLAAASAGGINFIDTARGYTASEELIGQGLRSRRSDFVLASKSMQRSKNEISRDIELSLKNLQTDYIDLYQLHNVRTDSEWEQVTAPEGALEGLIQAQKSGLVRHIGITSHSVGMMNHALDSGLFATMMLPYNVVESHNQKSFQLAHEKNVGTFAMKPLAGGFFPDAGPALRYLTADPNLDCILVGMSSPAEISANVSAIEQGPLNSEENETIKTWAKQAGQEFCRRCGYCLPCPQGIDIPTVFLLEGYYDRYELPDWAKERYAAMAVPATACQSCGQCKEKCPYGLPIPDKLARATIKLAK